MYLDQPEFFIRTINANSVILRERRKRLTVNGNRSRLIRRNHRHFVYPVRRIDNRTNG
jgi:hypothetical protein